MYEALNHTGELRKENHPLYKAIINRLPFVSPGGGHRVEVNEGIATYFVMGIKYASNDDKILEIAPEDFIVKQNMSDLLSDIVKYTVPADDSPMVWTHGFGWVEDWVKNESVAIMHPFPLRIALSEQRIMNKVHPEVYFEALTEDWLETRMGLISKVLGRIFKKGYVMPQPLASIVLKKTLARLVNDSYFPGRWTALALAFTICQSVTRKQAGNAIWALEFGMRKYPDASAEFYKAVKDLTLPEGHIVQTMLEMASADMVRRKLTQ